MFPDKGDPVLGQWMGDHVYVLARAETLILQTFEKFEQASRRYPRLIQKVNCHLVGGAFLDTRKPQQVLDAISAPLALVYGDTSILGKYAERKTDNLADRLIAGVVEHPLASKMAAGDMADFMGKTPHNLLGPFRRRKQPAGEEYSLSTTRMR